MPAKQILLQIPNKQMLLSDNKHNRLQKDVMEHFLPRFARGARLIYLKPSSKSKPFCDIKSFSDAGVQIDHRDRLSDIVLLHKKKKWVYLIQAITSRGQAAQLQITKLKKMFSTCSYGLIFVYAFSDFMDLSKYTDTIAWETEVWIAEMPDHLIHFNGDRFLGPR